MNFERDLINEEEKYKDIHETHVKILQLQQKYSDINFDDLIVLLQQELRKLENRNRPKNTIDIAQQVQKLYNHIELLKHPSELMTWDALVLLANKIQCLYSHMLLNSVTKFFLEATYNSNKRVCKLFWNDPSMDVKQFMEEKAGFVLCVQNLENKQMHAYWIKSNDYNPQIHTLYDDVSKVLYFEMLNRFCEEDKIREFFILCPLVKQQQLNFDFMKIFKAVQENTADALHGTFTKREEVLECYSDIEMSFPFQLPENNLYLQKSNTLKC